MPISTRKSAALLISAPYRFNHREAERLATRVVGLGNRASHRAHAQDEALPLADRDRLARVQLVERVGSQQHLFIGGQREASLDQALSRLDGGQVMQVIQAFASYLRAVNLAEKIHRIRRSRVYQMAESGAQRGSLEAVLGVLKEQGIDAASLAEEINSLRIQPVFTAHPTEATRRTIQEKEYDIVLRLVERLNPELTPGEEELALPVTLSGKTA